MVTPAAAATAAAVWTDETYEKIGKYGQPELDDSALGVWCYAKSNKANTQNTMVFERSQICFCHVTEGGPTAVNLSYREKLCRKN